MNSTNFITEWLNSMVQKFTWLKYKYEFKDKTHYVAVFPQSAIEFNEEYCEQENSFYDAYVAAYPDEELLIGIEEDFFTCSKDALVIQNKASGFEIPFNNDHVEIKQYNCKNDACNNLFPNMPNFSLAA